MEFYVCMSECMHASINMSQMKFANNKKIVWRNIFFEEKGENLRKNGGLRKVLRK